MPCRLAPPDPRARPRSTVSAWSSRVWPSSTAARAERRPRHPGARGSAPSRAAASGPPASADLDAHDRGLEPERAAPRAPRRPRLGRAVLQAVVDRDRRRRAARASGASNAVGGGERERVGAAGERDEHGRTARAARQRAAHREPHLGDGGVEPGSACPPAHRTGGRAPRVDRPQDQPSTRAALRRVAAAVRPITSVAEHGTADGAHGRGD